MSIINPEGVPLDQASIGVQRPYYNKAGNPVIQYNTGKLDAGGNPIYAERIVANATLRKDEWISLDEAVLESARERLVVVADLISSGLTNNVGGLGTIISEWEKSSEMTDAEVTMDGESKVNKDRQAFGLNGVPIPVIHKDYTIGERVLQASRMRGASLDVTSSTEAGRSVARKSEQMVFNGLPLGASNSAGNSYQVYGLTNHPNRATYTISDWSAGGTSEETILSEILTMIETAKTTHRRYGPYRLYIPATYERRFNQDYKANSDKTLMQRAMEVPGLAAIRVSDVLATGNVVLVDFTRSSIDLAIASDLVNVQWQSGSGFTNNFKAYAAWAPRIKTDYDDRCGIVHGSTS